MDYAKLLHINAVWLRQADDERLTNDVMERFKKMDGVSVDETTRARVAALMPGLKERARTLVELAESAAFLGRQVPLAFNDKAQKLLTPEARTMLGELARDLAAVPDFTPEAIDTTLRNFAEKHELKLGKVAQPVRAAVTGSNTSPGIDATLQALGKDETLARLGAVLHG